MGVYILPENVALRCEADFVVRLTTGHQLKHSRSGCDLEANLQKSLICTPGIGGDGNYAEQSRVTQLTEENQTKYISESERRDKGTGGKREPESKRARKSGGRGELFGWLAGRLLSCLVCASLTACFLHPSPLVVPRRPVVGGELDREPPAAQDSSAVSNVSDVEHRLLHAGKRSRSLANL